MKAFVAIAAISIRAPAAIARIGHSAKIPTGLSVSFRGGHVCRSFICLLCCYWTVWRIWWHAARSHRFYRLSIQRI